MIEIIYSVNLLSTHGSNLSSEKLHGKLWLDEQNQIPKHLKTWPYDFTFFGIIKHNQLFLRPSLDSQD